MRAIAPGSASSEVNSWCTTPRRARLLRCGRCRIEFAVALLDPPRADMALHRDADMVWAIVGTRRVKFLSGFASGQGENTLAQAQALRTGFASRRFAFGCSWRP